MASETSSAEAAILISVICLIPIGGLENFTSEVPRQGFHCNHEPHMAAQGHFSRCPINYGLNRVI